MTDEEAKALARTLVEEAIHQSSMAARVERVYHVHDKDLYRVAVVAGREELHLGFTLVELTEELDKARQKARFFVSQELRKRQSGAI